MNDFTDPKALAIALLGIIVGLLSYFGREALKRQDQQGDRLNALERESLTKEDLQSFHQENVGRLDRQDKSLDEIKALIERNHEDAVRGRHDTNNRLNTVVAQVAKLEGRLEERGLKP